MSNIYTAFILTLISGLSTVIGGLLCLFVKNYSNKALSLSMSFAASVMLYLSIFELNIESIKFLNSYFSNYIIVFIIAFYIGIILIKASDKYVSKYLKDNTSLYKIGIITSIALMIHNFPEGILVFNTSINHLRLGIIFSISIILHNIPEGIAISMPIYYSTKSKAKVILYCFLSGMSELIGGILSFVLFKNILNDGFYGIMFAITSGIMIYISVTELLPTSFKYGKIKYLLYGFILGLAFILLTTRLI